MDAKTIAVIPARGGSKRIPRKNIKPFCGKPMIAYSIEAAIRAGIFDEIIVSTDDEEIADIAKNAGASVPFMRPKELSDDFTATGAVVEHAIKFLQARGDRIKFVCTIYATAPLIDEFYIKLGLEKLRASNAKNAFSCTSMPFPIWRTFKIAKDGRCEMFWRENFAKRSQDLEEAYQDAGQFYWTNLDAPSSDEIFFGRDSIAIVLPRHLVQDIDTPQDWIRAEFLYEAVQKSREKA
ncbi:pseudaminic acid cytidylyltransferase [uncultured Campylobacter sp.]|uniref:pseudaminic acid cytidylyltransferase n=1 Tax=uncultured Campylobacter sp. TaxID=218934 RepID=UPI000F0E0B2D|nr:pseudaminic acid cytidylyltransferase [uncultured Campylobacter sp.]RKV96043.1 MAG: pseudaminic acid cytidylyltransferase [Campylobacter sp.]